MPPSPAPQIDRLDFTLPEFTRVSWTSDAARRAWEPKLARIAGAWPEIECRTVASGLRPCGIITLPPGEFVSRARRWAKLGLSALPLEMGGRPHRPFSGTFAAAESEPPFMFRLVVAAPRDLSAFLDALDSGDHRETGRLLGHPPCCHEFFKRVWVEEGLEDTTWPMALATTSPADGSGRAVEVAGPPQANILWRWLGIRAVPHLPCRFDCEATAALADKFLDAGREAGYGQEAAWLLEVLAWPVEWSALHGIAEIKTPVLKVATRTDATAQKYVVRRAGVAPPPEGASGLNFPYRLSREAVFTQSPSFRRGLDNPLPIIDGPAVRAPQGTILDETLRRLDEEGQLATKSIRSIHLTPYFTVVELNDGSVGACMSYYDPDRAGTVRRELGEILADDPLLIGLLFRGERRGRWGLPGEQGHSLVECLRATVLSALSADILRRGGDRMFETSASPPPALFTGAKRALVIGFGGLMESLAHAEDVRELSVHDLAYGEKRPEMDSLVSRYRERNPDKTITLSDGRDTEERMRGVDLVAITGSALSNGTLDGLLRMAKGVPRVIIQGQSAAIHPKALFDRGVHLVATAVKPRELVGLAERDPRGETMRPLLEGGLPSIYLAPRKGDPSDATTVAKSSNNEGGHGFQVPMSGRVIA